MKFLLFVIITSFSCVVSTSIFRFQYDERTNEGVIKSVKSLKEKILKENRDTIKLPDVQVPLEPSGKLSLEKGELKGFSNFQLHNIASVKVICIRVPIKFFDLKIVYNYNIVDFSKSNESGQVSVNLADACNEFIVGVGNGETVYLSLHNRAERKVGAMEISYSGQKPEKVVSEALEDAFRTKVVDFVWKQLEIEIQAILDDKNKWIGRNHDKAMRIMAEIFNDLKKKSEKH